MTEVNTDTTRAKDRLLDLYNMFPDSLAQDFQTLSTGLFDGDDIATIFYLMRLGQEVIMDNGVLEVARDLWDQKVNAQQQTEKAQNTHISPFDLAKINSRKPA